MINWTRKTWPNVVAVIAIAASVLLQGCGGSGAAGTTKTVVGTGGEEPAGYIGSPLAFSTEIYAPDTIASLEAGLRTITGTGADGNMLLTESFTEGLSGAVRTHIDASLHLSSEIRPGDYVLVLTVTDRKGNRHTADYPVKIMIDTSLPTVLDLETGINAAGNDLHLAAHVTAPNKLSKITVTVRGEEWNDEYVFDGASIVGKVDYHFHEHALVDKAPAGEYEVTITATDQKGRASSAIGSFTKR